MMAGAAEPHEIRSRMRATKPQRDAVMHLDCQCRMTFSTDRLFDEDASTHTLPATAVAALRLGAAPTFILPLMRWAIRGIGQNRATGLTAGMHRASWHAASANKKATRWGGCIRYLVDPRDIIQGRTYACQLVRIFFAMRLARWLALCSFTTRIAWIEPGIHKSRVSPRLSKA